MPDHAAVAAHSTTALAKLEFVSNEFFLEYHNGEEQRWTASEFDASILAVRSADQPPLSETVSPQGTYLERGWQPLAFYVLPLIIAVDAVAAACFGVQSARKMLSSFEALSLDKLPIATHMLFAVEKVAAALPSWPREWSSSAAEPVAMAQNIEQRISAVIRGAGLRRVRRVAGWDGAGVYTPLLRSLGMADLIHLLPGGTAPDFNALMKGIPKFVLGFQERLAKPPRLPRTAGLTGAALEVAQFNGAAGRHLTVLALQATVDLQRIHAVLLPALSWTPGMRPVHFGRDNPLVRQLRAATAGGVAGPARGLRGGIIAARGHTSDEQEATQTTHASAPAPPPAMHPGSGAAGSDQTAEESGAARRQSEQGMPPSRQSHSQDTGPDDAGEPGSFGQPPPTSDLIPGIHGPRRHPHGMGLPSEDSNEEDELLL